MGPPVLQTVPAFLRLCVSANTIRNLILTLQHLENSRAPIATQPERPLVCKVFPDLLVRTRLLSIPLSEPRLTIEFGPYPKGLFQRDDLVLIGFSLHRQVVGFLGAGPAYQEPLCHLCWPRSGTSIRFHCVDERPSAMMEPQIGDAGETVLH